MVAASITSSWVLLWSPYCKLYSRVSLNNMLQSYIQIGTLSAFVIYMRVQLIAESGVNSPNALQLNCEHFPNMQTRFFFSESN